MSDITVADLTQTTLNGTGVFDVLMRATKVHLEAEFSKNRIKGPEYATVYLGSVESVMRTSLEFLMQRQRIGLEAQLMAQQVLVAQAEVLKANAQVQVALAEVEKTRLEVEILRLSVDKIPAEIAHIKAQTGLVTQQKLNAAAQELNIPKEGLVLDGQKCKLDAEYDMILGQTLKGASETTLLAQKVVTEKAQTTSMGVDADSILGKQKALYGAQTAGFRRDAEQKAAKLMVDTWNVRRTTDEGTSANSANRLTDLDIGHVINKMVAGLES